MTINDCKFAAEGGGFHVTTGPASTLWNPANKASGDYTIKATFNEPEFMNLNDASASVRHCDSAGNDLGTADMSILYCGAYGNGTFIVRGFGPAAFQVNGARAQRNDAIAARRHGQGQARHAGHRALGQGRQSRVLDQRHGRRQLSTRRDSSAPAS